MTAHCPETDGYYCYMLKCRDGAYYTGWTTNLAKRLNAHNAGKGGAYTGSRLPVSLAYWESLDTRSAAMKREAFIKTLTHEKKEALIGGINDGTEK